MVLPKKSMIPSIPLNRIGPCLNTLQTPGVGYMETVQQWDANTLLPIINDHVALGTIVHTDKWAA